MAPTTGSDKDIENILSTFLAQVRNKSNNYPAHNKT